MEEVIESNISTLMPSSEAASNNHYLEPYKTNAHAHIIGNGRELIGSTKVGFEFAFKLGVSEVKYADRKIYAGFTHDLTQQKIDEERLKNYATHLEDLSSKERRP